MSLHRYGALREYTFPCRVTRVADPGHDKWLLHMSHPERLNAVDNTHSTGQITLCRLRSARCPCRYGALNVQAGTQLCDGAFQREVASGRLSSASLDDFSCIALAGVASEYLRFGYFCNSHSRTNVKLVW